MNKKALIDGKEKMAGFERRDPEITQPDYMTLKHISSFMKELADKLPDGKRSRIVDIGCGKKPYEPLFETKALNYVGIDCDDSSDADIIVDLNLKLPFDDNVFDLVICTQVLEHVKRPEFLVDEMYRVCKQEGIVFTSAPFVWEIHNYPADYWRFTEQGLELLFPKFTSVDITPCGNSAQGLMQTFSLLINRRSQKEGLKKKMFSFLNRHLLELAGKCGDDLLPANYIVKAVK